MRNFAVHTSFEEYENIEKKLDYSNPIFKKLNCIDWLCVLDKMADAVKTLLKNLFKYNPKVYRRAKIRINAVIEFEHNSYMNLYQADLGEMWFDNILFKEN